MKVSLVPDLPAYGSFSMERYYLELFEAILRSVRLPDTVYAVEFPSHTYSYKSLRDGLLKRWLLRFDRWITYPFLLSTLCSDVYHVMDQSYGHLTNSLNADKTVITCHDLIPLRALRGLTPINYERIHRGPFYRIMQGLQKAKQIIAVSNATKADLQDLLEIDPQKITVIYSGKGKAFNLVDAESATCEKDRLRLRFSLPRDAKLLLHVGSSAPYKNTKAIVRALPLVKRHQDIWLVRVGAQLPDEDWREAEKLSVADRIIFVGNPLNDEELASYYRSCDLLVYPSVCEGFGWPALEAMSCGTPVVTSLAPALLEVVGEAGVSIDPNDSNSLAEAILRVLCDHRLREELVLQGLSQSKKFDWDNAANLTLGVYQRIAAEYHD